MDLISLNKMLFFKKKGSILIFTLWIVLIIAVLALGLAYTARLEVKSVSYNLDDLKMHYIIKGGVNRILSQLKEYYDIRGYDTVNSYKNLEGKQYSLGVGNYEIINIIDEESKININMVPKQTLMQIPQFTEAVANYVLSKRPFKNVENLILSENLTEQEISELRENWITVYGDGNINFNTCENSIIDLLKGLSSLQKSSLEGKINNELVGLKYSCGGSESVNVEIIKKSVFEGVKEVRNSQNFFEHASIIRTKLKNNDEIQIRKEQMRAKLKGILYDCCVAKSDKMNKGPYCKNWAGTKSSQIKDSFFAYIVNEILDHVDIKSSNYRITIKGKVQNVEKKVTAVGNKFNNTVKFWHSHYYNKYQ